MQDRYEPGAFEAKWRERWQAADLFATREEEGRPKFYGLEFFPYPSGAGLSVGHARNYIPADVLCRMKYMQGHNVLHPMGFDAFGLPAEVEAIKKQRHPGPMIDEYSATYERQLNLIGISYDWSRTFKSCEPTFYRWTQWIFKLLYDRGLAYRKNAAVNWCPVDKTVLADEEVQGGLCWRCGSPVEKKAIPQWFFRITDYAQRLIDDLDDVDWPEGIKHQQRNWIGRSEGVEFEMAVSFGLPSSTPKESDGNLEVVTKVVPETFRVFTTRIDTIFGVTFCVLAPEHPLVETIKKNVDAARVQDITDYQTASKSLSDTTRQSTEREKTGVWTGAYAINPANGKHVPIWVADYVMMGYGTGAIMAVPGHDDRDFEFAHKFGLDVIPVIAPTTGEAPELPFPAKDGVLINSGSYTCQTVKEAQENLAIWIESNNLGERKVNYKLRDWLISRQRYWGCPIPIVYDKDGHAETVPDNALPVELPVVDHYEPGADGTSPLALISDFVNTTTRDGALGTRETDTMGGFACSSWYFLRFIDPHNDDQPWDFEKAKAWMPVDCYVGGAEHAVMHLLYARFWTKVLYDAGHVTVKEPFQRLRNQGMVQATTYYRKARAGETLEVGEDGIRVEKSEFDKTPATDRFTKSEKMSKSKGNVVTPDEAVEQYGADALRVYELFIAPFEQNVAWSEDGIQGSVRFLHRVFKLASDLQEWYQPNWRWDLGNESAGQVSAIRRNTHKLLIKATEDIEKFAFNTYVSACMVFVNTLNDILKTLNEPTEQEQLALSEAIECFLIALAPMAPHSADEIWESYGRSGFTYQLEWPQGRPELAKDDLVTVAIQVNGKLRDTLDVPADVNEEELKEAALSAAKIQVHLEGKTIRKVIVVPGRLVNIVAN
jgi:leucyl-tRNA synthetase